VDLGCKDNKKILYHTSKSRYFYKIWKRDSSLWLMLSILHTASRFQIHDFYGTFGTVMDIAGRIGLVRALYMPDKPNLHIRLGKRKNLNPLHRGTDLCKTHKPSI